MVLGGLQIGDFLRKKISGKSLQGKKKSLNQGLEAWKPSAYSENSRYFGADDECSLLKELGLMMKLF